MISKEILLIWIVSGSTLMDLCYEKIDNIWLVFALVISAFYKIYEEGFLGVFSWISGMTIPILLLYFLFYFHLLGAGDIKLFSVIGGFLGSQKVLICMGYSFAFGAIFSILILFICGNFKQRVLYFLEYFSNYRQTKERIPYILSGNKMENYHFTVPILLSILLYVGGFY